MLEAAIVLGVVAAISAPHVLPLQEVAPRIAGWVWICALGLRAAVGAGAVIFVLVYLPQTLVFDAVAQWCWHTVLPILATHLGLSGHRLADFAVVLPSLAIAGSVLWLLFGLARAGLALRRHLKAYGRREGPYGSTLMEDAEVLVAVPSFGRGRLLVSRGALDAMDEAELVASLAHERAHLTRGHRPLLFAGAVLAALGRPLPGTAAARRALVLSMERDADEYAVRLTRDPLALASAICKATGGRAVAASVTSLAGVGAVSLRLDYLLEDRVRRGSQTLDYSARALAGLTTAMIIALCLTLPAWALSAPAEARPETPHSAICPH